MPLSPAPHSLLLVLSPFALIAYLQAARTQRYAAIAEGGKSIDKKLKESAAVMKIPKGGTPHWNAYTDFVNGIVVQVRRSCALLPFRSCAHFFRRIDYPASPACSSSSLIHFPPLPPLAPLQGLARLVVVSLRRLVDMLSPERIRKNQDLPLIIIDLCLLPAASSASGSSAQGAGGAVVPAVPRQVRFVPDVVEDSAFGVSLYDIANGWVDSFYHAATVFKRLDDAEVRLCCRAWLAAAALPVPQLLYRAGAVSRHHCRSAFISASSASAVRLPLLSVCLPAGSLRQGDGGRRGGPDAASHAE